MWCEASLCLCGWTGMQTSQSSDTVPPHSCHFLRQSCTQRLLSSLSVKERVRVFVCSVLSRPNVNDQATAVDTSTLLPPALDLFRLLNLFFHTRLWRTRVERKCDWAQERTGMEGWRSEGQRDGGNRNCFCFDPAYTF